jgi:MFS family permease
MAPGTNPRNGQGLSVLYLTAGIDYLSFGIILPLLPLYGDRFGADKLMIGVLVAAFSAMQFVFAPLWGSLSDRLGRRPVLMVSIAGNCAALVLFGLAESYWMLLASRVLSGISTANIGVASAYIADVSPPELRAKRIGILGAAFGVGLVFGPITGGELTRLGAATPGFFAAGLALINLCAVYLLLPESLPPEARATVKAGGGTSRWQAVRTVPALRSILAIAFVQVMAFGMFEMAFVLFLNARLGFEERAVGWVFAYIGLLLIVVQGGLIGPIVQRLGQGRVARLGLLLTSIGMVLTTLTAEGAWLAMLAFVSIVAVGQGLVQPSWPSLVSGRAPAGYQGVVLGLYRSVRALARVVGPVVAGLLYGAWGENLPFLVGGVLMACTWLVAGAVVGGVTAAPVAADPEGRL